jgi:ketosteroid isomerase-like protein
MRVPQWIQSTFDALDAGDAEGFCEHLAQDCSFIYANQPPVTGRDDIRDAVDEFIGSVETTDHTLDEYFQAPGRAVVRGQVEYTRHDGSTLQVPFANIFDIVDEGIQTYQIYVDISELYQ